MRGAIGRARSLAGMRVELRWRSGGGVRSRVARHVVVICLGPLDDGTDRIAFSLGPDSPLLLHADQIETLCERMEW